MDESGSVLGHENDIKKAYDEFINARKNLNKDKVSIILFDNNARIIC